METPNVPFALATSSNQWPSLCNPAKHMRAQLQEVLIASLSLGSLPQRTVIDLKLVVVHALSKCLALKHTKEQVAAWR